jgi:hypothetical protein
MTVISVLIASPIRAVLISAAVTAATMSLTVPPAWGTDPWAELRPGPQDLVGTLSCSSASCHGRTSPPMGPPMTGHLSQQEFVHWLGGAAKYHGGRQGYDPRAHLEASSADPHALAALRIQQPRFQEVLRRASRLPDGSTDDTMYARCAQCHDPLGLATSSNPSGEAGRRPGEGLLLSDAANSQTLTPAPPQRERGQIHERGIGCESCHGSARQWLTVHYERDITREQLAERGMIDTKNLLVRARQCASCHVGSAGQDMNHDMIAAGHPPLRFELASYEALIPKKHWNDQPRRRAEPDYEVQLWAAGRIAAAEAALATLEGRARRAEARGQEPGDGGERAGTWPEFAEANCFVCHQPLRSDVNQPSLASLMGRGGAPAWQLWNVAIVPQSGESFAKALADVRTAMNNSLVPTPTEVAQLAAVVRHSLRTDARLSPSGAILDSNDQELGIDAALKMLSNSSDPPTWDRSCHELAAIIAVQRSLRDRTDPVAAAASAEFRQRFQRLAAALRFTSKTNEWPAVFSDSPPMSLAEVATELATIRQELTVAAKSIGQRHASQEALP